MDGWLKVVVAMVCERLYGRYLDKDLIPGEQCYLCQEAVTTGRDAVVVWLGKYFSSCVDIAAALSASSLQQVPKIHFASLSGIRRPARERIRQHRPAFDKIVYR